MYVLNFYTLNGHFIPSPYTQFEIDFLYVLDFYALNGHLIPSPLAKLEDGLL
jgi:hypothetical protein